MKVRSSLYIILLVLSVVLFSAISCEEEKKPVKYEGEVVLSSEKIQEGDIYIVYGFSFEKGENIPYSLTSGTPPDIIVSNLTDVQNNITGAVLNSPDNTEAFFQNFTGSTYEEAKNWFDNYNEVTATEFIPLVDSVELFQVWTIQTSAGKFAKILIRKMDIITDNALQDYIDITAEYKYQPDGSRIFSNQ